MIETKVAESLERSALGYLLAPMTERTFFDGWWARKPLLIHRESPDYYRDLFSLADLDRTLASAKGNQRVKLALVAAAGSDRRTEEGPVDEIMHDRAFKRFVQGDTVRLSGIDSLWPAVTELCASLRQSLSASVHANAYLTPENAQGFNVHFDDYDVLILQVGGAKEWFVYEAGYEMPVDGELPKVWNKAKAPEDESKLRVLEHATLETGDLLYIPRGFYHKALTSTTASLHLTLSINPIYWVSFLRKALELAALESPELREALPPGFLASGETDGELRDRFRALLALLAGQADFDAAAKAFRGEQFRGIYHPPDGHFADLAKATSLRPEAVVSHRAGVPCSFGEAGDKAFLLIGSNSFQGPAAVAPALRFVEAHPRFRVADLPGELSAASTVVRSAGR
jgi:lysine-specific demethylase/histidyl-hydroxylase NO66